MNINFKAKNLDIPESITDYAEKKLQTLNKFLRQVPTEARVDIELSKDQKHNKGDVYRTDITLVAGEIDLHAVGHGETLQASLDVAKDELINRLTKDKKKKLHLIRKGGRMIKKMLRMGR